jgi:Na+/proline symporter
LGVAGYFIGPMLGVFLLGMLTRTRGSDAGNIIAVTAGLLIVFATSGRLHDLFNLLAGTNYQMPAWLPQIEFTWYALVGAIATLAVGLLFRTPLHVIQATEERAESSGFRRGDEAMAR